MNARPYGWPSDSIDGPPVWMDASFSELVRRHPQLDPLTRHLPTSAGQVMFDTQREIDRLQSSYAARGYGAFIYALLRVLKPRSAVEVGVFQGFSLLTAAAALRDNGAGHITGYDLFEAYPHRHADRAGVEAEVLRSGLQPWITLEAADLEDIHHRHQAVDYLHVDVSNNGDTYQRVFDHWTDKVRQVILLEGGSQERDNVDWMHRYHKPAIGPAIAMLRRAHPQWSMTVLCPFPSMTVALKSPSGPG